MAVRRAIVLAAVILPVCFAARAAELAGVRVPEMMQADGHTLRLNGFGLRTYSILRIHVYVAALYLQYPSADPRQILDSPETKVLTVRFLRDVGADTARKAWSDGLENNCLAPCHLDPNDVARFLAVMPAMHDGDNYSFLFTQRGVTVTIGGQPVGVISNPVFARAMLASFLGPNPGSVDLKQDLLAGHG
jgi:hypothetical protein